MNINKLVELVRKMNKKEYLEDDAIFGTIEDSILFDPEALKEYLKAVYNLDPSGINQENYWTMWLCGIELGYKWSQKEKEGK